MLNIPEKIPNALKMVACFATRKEMGNPDSVEKVKTAVIHPQKDVVV